MAKHDKRYFVIGLLFVNSVITAYISETIFEAIVRGILFSLSYALFVFIDYVSIPHNNTKIKDTKGYIIYLMFTIAIFSFFYGSIYLLLQQINSFAYLSKVKNDSLISATIISMASSIVTLPQFEEVILYFCMLIRGKKITLSVEERLSLLTWAGIIIVPSQILNLISPILMSIYLVSTFTLALKYKFYNHRAVSKLPNNLISAHTLIGELEKNNFQVVTKENRGKLIISATKPGKSKVEILINLENGAFTSKSPRRSLLATKKFATLITVLAGKCSLIGISDFTIEIKKPQTLYIRIGHGLTLKASPKEDAFGITGSFEVAKEVKSILDEVLGIFFEF